MPLFVSQAHLNARWQNLVPGLGVALALVLAVAAIRRAGAVVPAAASRRSGATRPRGRRPRPVAALDLGRARVPPAGRRVHGAGTVPDGGQGELEAAVHLGEHHGWHGSLLLLSALVLSRVQAAGRLRIWLLGGTAALAAYGAVNAMQDFWQEQLVKRGTVDWAIPSALYPGLKPVTLVTVLLAGSGGLAVEPRAGDTTSMSGAPRMVFLGFGKYVRADRIYALEPIVGDDRGNGRRTLVWVEGMPERDGGFPDAADDPRGDGCRVERRRSQAIPAPSCRPAAAVRRRRLSARELLAGSVHDVAHGLLGCTFLLDGVGGVIVEVEAYSPDDPASHAFRGRTERNASMFLEPGTLYVYRSYGIHWCVNVACEGVGTGAAVLLRAIEPTHGLAEMRTRRGEVPDRLLCSGPGRLTQALAITREHDGCSIVGRPSHSNRLRPRSPSPSRHASGSPKPRTCPGAT